VSGWVVIPSVSEGSVEISTWADHRNERMASV